MEKQLSFFEDEAPPVVEQPLDDADIPMQLVGQEQSVMPPPEFASRRAERLGEPESASYAKACDLLKKQFGINPELPAWSALVWHKAHELDGKMSVTVDELIARAQAKPHRTTQG